MKTIYAHMRDAFVGAGIINSSFWDSLISTKKNMELANKALENFGFNDIDSVLNSYPHELSGGMLQRVLCATVSFIKPKWILADEPTKGLDEQNKKLIMDNLQKMFKESNSSMLLITHDLEFAHGLCKRIYRLRDGKLYADD